MLCIFDDRWLSAKETIEVFRFPSHNDSHCTFNNNSTAIAIAKVGYKFWCWICFWCSGMLVTSPWVYLTWWICKITRTLPKGKCRYDQWSCVGTSRWQKEFLPLRNSSEGGFFFKPQLVIIVMIIIFGLSLEDIMIIITFKPWLVIILIFLLLTFITVCYKNAWER